LGEFLCLSAAWTESAICRLDRIILRTTGDRIKVVEEATAGTSPNAHKAALQALEYLQNGAIVHMDEVVEAMKAFRRSKE